MRWLLLWDIDRTLVYTSDRDRLVYHRVVETMTGRRITVPPRSGLGSLERDIVKAYLLGAGLTANDAEAVLPSTLDRVIAELSNTTTLKEPESWEMPSAYETLRSLSHCPDVLSTVVTGNHKPVAEAKLRAFGLLQFVRTSIGAYGEEGDTRADLVRLARARASTFAGVTFAWKNVVVIGDSANDVRAARACGATCVAVSTGRYSPEVLTSLGADVVFESLAHFHALFIGSER